MWARHLCVLPRLCRGARSPLDGCAVFQLPLALSLAGASEGKRVPEGVNCPARGRCWADCPQHRAWRVGSDDLEGMAAVGMTWSTFYSSRLSCLQITEA